jgi:SAM-dependent methyltransferase
VSKDDQYARQAERWSETQYADAESYLRHRADLVVSLGPKLRPGDLVLDLACGDGGLGVFLRDHGLSYRGVDTTPAMVEEARRKGIEAELGDLNAYVPPEPVEATTCFRAIYYAHDRAAFFRQVAGYTTRKLVFDLNPRQYRVEDVLRDLHGAGLTRVELRPFFAPQNLGLPAPAAAAFRLAERSGPLARLALRFRFSYLVAASTA